jgi:gamma-glutamyltranspeptidase/glutathione hydrolase
MTAADLRGYEVIWSEPVRVPYREHEVALIGLPAQGGLSMQTSLERLRPHDLGALGHYTESPEAFYHVAQAIREVWLGGSAGGKVSPHSDSVVVVDEAGNVAAALHSIYTSRWGTTGIFVDGVSISDSACFQQRLVDEVGPGARMPNAANPLIVLHQGRPVLATNEIGGGLVAATLQALVNMLDFGFTPKEAQDTPVMRHPDLSQAPDYPTQVTTGDFSPVLLEEVRALGLPIVEQEPWTGSGYGYWAGVWITKKGRLLGATDNGFGGCALGY